MFHFIDFENENIPSFIINDDKLIIESMKINDLCNKQINDLHKFDRYSVTIMFSHVMIINITFIIMTSNMG